MKAYQLLSGSLLLLTLTVSCAADPETLQPDRNERYAREFIKEFGVPDPNHNWSDAEKTTLTIKSTHGADVKVYYESESQLFLTGDLTIAPGSQEIPFIIPDGVSSLKVEANGRHYDVSIGSTLDLDNSPASRSFGSSAEYEGGKWKVDYATGENSSRENNIRFYRDDLAKIFFDEYPLGENNLWKKGKKASYADSYNDIKAENDKNPGSNSYYIYPIFWKNKNKEKGHTADNFRLGYYDINGSVWFDDPTMKNAFGNSDCTSPMSFLILSDQSNSSAFDPTFGENSDSHISNFDGMDQAYSLEGPGFTVQTQGIKITGRLTPSVMFGESGTTSAAPIYSRTRLWKNRYWNLTLDKMEYAYTGMVYYMPDKPVKFKVWRKDSNGNYGWVERERQALFIGVSAPPKENVINGYSYGDDTPVDFCDAVYFVAAEDPETKIGSSAYGSGAYSSYGPFIIAAEDLGGSFDWDFNDAVFSVSCVTRNSSDIAKEYYKSGFYPVPSTNNNLKLPYVYHIEVTPLAAGGTMPIYVAYHGKVSKYTGEPVENINPSTTKYNDIIAQLDQFNNNIEWEDGIWIVGTELHKWLGASTTDKAINAGEKVTHTGRSVKFYVDTEIKSPNAPSKENAPLINFSVIVDKDNSLGIDTSANFDPNGTDAHSPGITKFNGSFGTGTYQISPVSEDKNLTSPQMFCIKNSDWEWPKETHSINLAYPQFGDWAKDQNNNTGWHWSANKDHTVKRK